MKNLVKATLKCVGSIALSGLSGFMLGRGGALLIENAITPTGKVLSYAGVMGAIGASAYAWVLVGEKIGDELGEAIYEYRIKKAIEEDLEAMEEV